MVGIFSLEKEVGHLRCFSKCHGRSISVRTFLKELASSGKKELYGKAVAMCSGRSQGQWSDSVLENTFCLFVVLVVAVSTGCCSYLLWGFGAR